MRNAHKIWVRKYEGKRPFFGDLCSDGKIALKWILNME